MSPAYPNGRSRSPSRSLASSRSRSRSRSQSVSPPLPLPPPPPNPPNPQNPLAFTKHSFALHMVDRNLLADFVSFVESQSCQESLIFYGDLIDLEDRVVETMAIQTAPASLAPPPHAPVLMPEDYPPARAAGASHALARFLRASLPPATATTSVENSPAVRTAEDTLPPMFHDPTVVLLASLPPLPAAYPVPPQLYGAYAEFFDKFLQEGALLEVNVPAAVRARVARGISELGWEGSTLATVTLFDDVADEVLRTLYNDTFQRFVSVRRAAVPEAALLRTPPDADTRTVSSSDHSESGSGGGGGGSRGGRWRTLRGLKQPRSSGPVPTATEEDEIAELVGSLSANEAFFYFSMAAESGQKTAATAMKGEGASDRDEPRLEKKKSIKNRLLRGLPLGTASNNTFGDAWSGVGPNRSNCGEKSILSLTGSPIASPHLKPASLASFGDSRSLSSSSGSTVVMAAEPTLHPLLQSGAWGKKYGRRSDESGVGLLSSADTSGVVSPSLASGQDAALANLDYQIQALGLQQQQLYMGHHGMLTPLSHNTSGSLLVEGSRVVDPIRYYRQDDPVAFVPLPSPIPRSGLRRSMTAGRSNLHVHKCGDN
ncbi:hypothetical protein DFJ73DRAFT_851755 [Zopfochytrium polystomum]|nr:hypothetical protein DFJ73DRAFT_851755 [Zopfochytrium polystomum]